MDAYTKIIDLFIIIAGAYMLFWGFSGKGTVYKNENLKKGMEENYKKLIKWFCIPGGVIAILAGALDYIKIEPFAKIMFVILCVIVVLVCVVIIGFTDPKKIGHHKS